MGKFLVLGAGRMAEGIIYDLCVNNKGHEVVVYDYNYDAND